MQSYSIVEYFSGCEGHKCGYCKSPDTSLSQGMWAHKLTVEDYQDLIDRGWRRSGQYCYKPKMNKTCCPLYPIRCHASAFKVSKSQKKVAKKMQQFIQSGADPDDTKISGSSEKQGSQHQGRRPGISRSTGSKTTCSEYATALSSSRTQTSSTDPTSSKQPRQGVGADPSRPPCRKAKQIRMERKMEKLRTKGDSLVKPTTVSQTMQKNLTDHLPHLTQPSNPKHKLEIKLVLASNQNEEFLRTKKESWKLYQKYQCNIHKDTPLDCNEQQWDRFLVQTPLQFDNSGPGNGYGTFHNQYWIDDKLIAVGVIDVLPKCVSSVYLYYDTDYGFLSMGVYSALSEIHFVNQLQLQSPSLQFYYLGFYIHSCPKMRYKVAYKPSDLLCPETYNWVPAHLCMASLDSHPYARLNELNGGSPDTVDSEGSIGNLDDVRCLYRRSVVDYGRYKLHKYSRRFCRVPRNDVEVEDEQVQEYTSLVGRTCAKRMLLFRSSTGD